MRRVYLVSLSLFVLASCQVLDELVTVNGKPLSEAGGSGTSSQTVSETSKSQKSGWVKAAGSGAWIYFPDPGRDNSNRSAANGIYEWSGSASRAGNADGTGTLTWRSGGSEIYQYYGTLQEGVLEGDFLSRTYGSSHVSGTRFSRSRRSGSSSNPVGDVSLFAKVSLEPPASATAYSAPKPAWAPSSGTMGVPEIKKQGKHLGQGIYLRVTGTKYHIANTNDYPVWVRIQLYKVNNFGETELGGKIERRVGALDSIWRPFGGVWNKGKLLKMAKAE